MKFDDKKLKMITIYAETESESETNQECTTLILDLLYQLPIIDIGEYSTDWSESYKVSAQH